MRRELLIAIITVALIPLALAAEGSPKPSAPPPDQERAAQEERLDKAWKSLSVNEKLHVLQLHRALQDLPVKERQFIQDRIGRFLEMSAGERERLKKNKERWEKMTPEQRERARAQYERRKREFQEKWRREHPGQPLPSLPPPTDPNQIEPPPEWPEALPHERPPSEE